MTWLVWRAIGKHPRIFILALARVFSVFERGFAKMGHRWLRNIADKKNCVPGGQGSPQGPEAECGPAKTLGSSMKRRAVAPAASGYVLSGYVFSGAAFWIALFDVLAVFGLSSVSLHAESANSYFKHGESAEARSEERRVGKEWRSWWTASSPKN